MTKTTEFFARPNSLKLPLSLGVYRLCLSVIFLITLISIVDLTLFTCEGIYWSTRTLSCSIQHVADHRRLLDGVGIS